MRDLKIYLKQEDFTIREGEDGEVVFTNEQGGESLTYQFTAKEAQHVGEWFLALSKQIKREEG